MQTVLKAIGVTELKSMLCYSWKKQINNELWLKWSKQTILALIIWTFWMTHLIIILFPSYFIEHTDFRILLSVLFNRMSTPRRSANRWLGVLLHCSSYRGFHVYCRMWLPHLGQLVSKRRRKHGNAEDHFAIAGWCFSLSDLFVGGEGRCTNEWGASFTTKVNIDCCLVSIIFKSALTTLEQSTCENYLLSI